MIFNVFSAAVLGVTAFYMLTKERATVSHRMAWIPAAMALMELALCGALLFWDYPLLTLCLMACRLVVLTCCSLALKRDAAQARNRRRRRAVWRRVAGELQREAYAVPVASLHRCA